MVLFLGVQNSSKLNGDLPRIPKILISQPRRVRLSIGFFSAPRSYLRKVACFGRLTDLFFRNQRQALVCITRMSRKGDPVGPTSGRFRVRRFRPINRSMAVNLIIISLVPATNKPSATEKSDFLICLAALS